MQEKRRKLRKEQTEAEKVMWQKLRNRNFMGLKFRRQYSIGEYIVDFYCSKLRLVLEIDGEIHFTKDAKEYDRLRTKELQKLDIEVLRFTNEEVIEDIEGVLKNLKTKLNY